MLAMSHATGDIHFPPDHPLPFSFQQVWQSRIAFHDADIARAGVEIHHGHGVPEHVIMSHGRLAV